MRLLLQRTSRLFSIMDPVRRVKGQEWTALTLCSLKIQIRSPRPLFVTKNSNKHTQGGERAAVESVTRLKKRYLPPSQIIATLPCFD